MYHSRFKKNIYIYVYWEREKKRISDKILADFVTESSKLFFTNLLFNSFFLKVHPQNRMNEIINKRWKNTNTYHKCHQWHCREITRIESNNNHFIKNENQLQYLLQLVECRRNKFLKITKYSLKNKKELLKKLYSLQNPAK